MKGMKFFKRAIAAVLAAAFIVSGNPTGTIEAKASYDAFVDDGVKVEVREVTQALNKRGNVMYKDTGKDVSKDYITLTPGFFAKNVLEVKISSDEKKYKIRNISCSRNLKYNKTATIYDYNNDSVTYRFSFYPMKEKKYNFKFTVNGKEFKVKFNATTPVNKITFGNATLSTKTGMLGSLNSVTDATKGKVKVKMNKGYTLESIQIGRYKNVTDKDTKNIEPVLYFENHKNGKTLKLSESVQTTREEDKDGEYIENSLYATTIIRVNYVFKGTKGYVDYYLNKIVNDDND